MLSPKSETQYQNEVLSSPTGAVALGKDNTDALHALKVDTNGQLYIANPGAGGGGGTDVQYTDGDTQASPTGTVALGKDGTTVRALKVDSTGQVYIANPSAGGALFDVDTGAGTQNVQGVSIRKAASGGSVEGATLSDPLRIDPVGTTAQPASQSGTWNIGTVTTVTNVVHVDDNSSTLSVDDGGGSLTVDGTVAATQSGTWNVNNISGTVTLPTGASTAAKQPALGVAGTASADVITVQGIASMTALKVDGSGVTQPISGTVTASQSTATSLKAQAECYQGGSAVASGNPLQVTLANTGSNTNALKVDNSGVTQPISGTVTANAGTNLNTSLLAVESGGNLATIGTNTTNLPNVIGTAASAIPSKLLQIGGSDGTNARAVKVNTSGQLDIRPLTSSDQITTVPSGTQTISGTVTANAGSGTFTTAPIPSIAPPGTAYVRRFDYDGSNQPIYMGWAAPGTATSAASWAIQKLTWSATPGNCTIMQWADGNTTADNVWDNRASLSYS